MRRIRPVLLLATLGLAAACTNEADRVTQIDVLGQLADRLGGGRPEPLSPAEISAAVASVPGPVKFVEVEERGGQGIFVAIQRNGPYTTYATPAGLSVAFRDGLAVQGRGFGGDLMSSDEDRLLALLRARRSGAAPYVMRFLDGENKTVTYRYTCNVLPGRRTAYAAGAVQAPATRLEVHCVSPEGPDHISTFTVDDGGEILAARHWFGPLTGHLAYRTLRR